MALVTLGINHRTAPIELRERVAFTPERMAEALPQSCHIISDLVFDGLALACPMEID